MSNILSTSLPKDKSRSVPEITLSHMESLCNDVAKEIGDCANVCDLYIKKSALVKVLQGEHWHIQFLQWIEKFANRKQDFTLVLSSFVANVTTSTDTVVHTLDRKLVPFKSSQVLFSLISLRTG